jgi:hypothetical protein
MFSSTTRRTRAGHVCSPLQAGFFFAILSAAMLFSSAYALDLELAWDPSDSEVAGYKVYAGTASRSYTLSVDAGNRTGYTLTGLEDGKTYYIALTAYNSEGVESDYSNEITSDGTPVPSDSAPGGASSDEGGGGCFIATAAYGSYLAPQVRVLRDFRDNVLMTNGPGRSFVKFYYAVSPPIADVISRSPALRTLTRWYLTPIVYVVQYSKILLVITITVVMIPLLYSRVRLQKRRQPSGR